MEALINSISKYARAGKSPIEQEKLLSLEIVVSVLKRINPGPEVAVYFDEKLPQIEANRKDIEEVFLAFISNAINHNLSKEKIVNITFKEKLKTFEFCIADNGPGIDKEFHERIFAIFQTLDRRDAIENVGAGLAIVKKIVDEYDGKIWLESEKGSGSKFYFSWPKHQESEVE
jgi:signal transduction histidine kinase